MQTPQLTPAAERIRLAMAPDPADWFFTGEVVDHGEYGSAAECTCGHPVRYQFFIARADDGKRLPIGSHCIRESVPFLIAAGAEGLARELEQAARRVERDQNAARRVATARRELPQLRRDFKLLREWCWARRRDWQRHHGQDDWMPAVLYRPPKLPDAVNEDEAAKAIRRSYCSSWLAAVACALDEGFALPALPRNRKLREQLGNRVQRALADPYHATMSWRWKRVAPTTRSASAAFTEQGKLSNQFPLTFQEIGKRAVGSAASARGRRGSPRPTES
ncbi:MAG: hypothetical protein ACRDLY_15185 [Thermoleophilaceae bacterium]